MKIMPLTPILLAAVLVVLSQAARPKWTDLEGYTFEQYENDFMKSYDPSERALRATLFATKLREVTDFNSKPQMTYKKGINHLSDRTPKELHAMRGNRPMHLSRPAVPPTIRTSVGAAAPFEVNYAKSIPPILTAIKDQGMCGSCWAHAATEQVETYAALATGKLFVLSQQQLVSCVENTHQCGGTGGCAGATAELAFDYLTTKGGMTQEWMYGYSSYFGDVPKCAFNASKTTPVVKINGYTLNRRNDPAIVVNSLATTGPLAISVDASKWSDYESGVYQGCDYSQNITMDHAVQLVGYGTDKALGLDYWLVRNSWSGGWGEAGFIRLIKERGTPKCGWNNDWDTQGGGCKGDPNTVWACGQCGILYDTLYPNVAV